MLNKLKMIRNFLLNRNGLADILPKYNVNQLVNMLQYKDLFDYSPPLNEYEAYQLADKFNQICNPNYKFSEFGNIYLEDVEFYEYYKKFMDRDNWHSYDRKYAVQQLLKLTLDVEGDIVECGSYKGATAYLLCKFSQNNSKRVHLFDSFEGLSAPLHCDGTYWEKGSLTTSEDLLNDSLKEFNNYSVYKGWIPDRFPDVSNIKVSFLHIDVDLYRPTLDSLEYFFPRIASGGVVVCDDYGFKSCPGAKVAFDEFANIVQTPVLQLPTGQAIMIKRNK